MKTDKNIAAAAAAAAAREAKIAPFKKTGGYVTYGQYPQTSSGTDSTPIEWLVLDHDAKNNRTLLISRYGLDAKPYNEKYTDITWEQCTLRTWLNETFINKAFSAEERSAIRLTKVDNSSGQGYTARADRLVQGRHPGYLLQGLRGHRHRRTHRHLLPGPPLVRRRPCRRGALHRRGYRGHVPDLRRIQLPGDQRQEPVPAPSHPDHHRQPQLRGFHVRRAA